MTRRRVIFYSIFGAYHLLAFIFTIVMESSASVLFKLVGYVSWFKFITLGAFLMIVADFVWVWLDGKKHKKEVDAVRTENHALKAKVYDYQQESKVKPEAPKA